MFDIPENLNNALIKSAKEYNLSLEKNNHYDAINGELIRYEKKIIKRIDFTFINKIITVTAYIDMTSFWPKLFMWCHDNVPYFPFPPFRWEIKWKSLESLPVDGTEEFYYNKIKDIFNNFDKIEWDDKRK